MFKSRGQGLVGNVLEDPQGQGHVLRTSRILFNQDLVNVYNEQRSDTGVV